MAARTKIDDIQPTPGLRLRVYFPGGQPSRVMVATGRYSHDEQAHEMRPDDGGSPEWVPGWLVASQAGTGR